MQTTMPPLRVPAPGSDRAEIDARGHLITGSWADMRARWLAEEAAHRAVLAALGIVPDEKPTDHRR